MKKNSLIFLQLASLIVTGTILLLGCKKLVDIKPPTNFITTSQTFKDSLDATSAILGIYSSEINTGGSISFGNGAITIDAGLSADELQPFNGGNQFFLNTLTPIYGPVLNHLWAPGYSLLYEINACIEGLQTSKSLSTNVKNQLIGEAKFQRALVNFYLVNMFGNVPLVTTSNYIINQPLSQSSKSQVYDAIISDLKEAQILLRNDYSISGGDRIRANKWAATALLARIYLYNNNFTDAITLSSSLISNVGQFNLVNDLNSVFLKNSAEAILQLNINSNTFPFNATTEANAIQPAYSGFPPTYFLSSQLLSSFEKNDLRKTAWIDSSVYSGRTYYYPYKYKIGGQQRSLGGPTTEYYMVLRLAEQYLIRAEAYANLNNYAAAVEDLNVLRMRAGLPTLSMGLVGEQVFAAIAQERRIELFAEWGHRWLDLKRSQKVDSVMAVATPQKYQGGAWHSFQQLYPIPSVDLLSDPNLKQNPGY